MTILPRMLIAAPASGSGKTTISVGIMAALARRMAVQAFKVGPDFIDPMYHTVTTGRTSRNLDSWMTSVDHVRKTFTRASRGVQVAVVEGVMGLYDGYDAISERGSTAELAKLLEIPLILILDASGMARSAAAIVLGCRDYDPAINLAGVICNHVAGERHATWLRQAIERIGVPLLGCIPNVPALKLPERHLGLTTVVGREKETETFIKVAGDVVVDHVDLDRLLAISREVTDLADDQDDERITQATTVSIAVGRDEAFCFYYEDNLDALRRAGAQIVFFSPLHDDRIPLGVSGIYLGGGYPELYADPLSKNQSMYAAICDAVQEGMPIYAECGGYQWLAETFSDMTGNPYPGLGLIPGHSHMTSRLHLGYRWVKAAGDTLLLRTGEQGRGHEFHYSEFEGNLAEHAFQVGSTSEVMERNDGYARNNILASYIHLHFDSNLVMAVNFITNCLRWQDGVRKQNPNFREVSHAGLSNSC